MVHSPLSSTKTGLILLLALTVTACDNGQKTDNTTLSSMAQLGEQLFSDTSLSVSGSQSCASCHATSHAFADPNGAAVSVGGPHNDLPGFRNAPSLAYASFTPRFHMDPVDGPVGGFFRDGRSKSLADQATLPLRSPFEMGGDATDNTAASVIARFMNSPNLPAFTRVFGDAVLNDPDLALQDIGFAIAAFESEAPAFHPFNSKFDYFRKGAVQLTAQEVRGFALFTNPAKGNCSACHISTSRDGVTPPLFTDFTYDNLGLPRNTSMAVNDDATTLPYVPTNSSDGIHKFYDLGACNVGTESTFPREPETTIDGEPSPYCGQFKVPTLRNIALTAPYFHNGVFSTLQDAVGFYVRRDTNPDEFYPAVGNEVTKFDDLPADFGGQFKVDIAQIGSDINYYGNVNVTEVPYERHLGEAPRLTPTEINDLVSFLCTLTDGYDPAHPENYVWPAQCQAAEPL